MMTAMRFFLLLGLLVGAAPVAAQVEAEAVPTQEVAQSEPEATPAQESVPSEAAPVAAPVAEIVQVMPFADSLEAVDDSEQIFEMEFGHNSRSVVQFGTDVHVLPGDTVSEVVVIGGSLLVEGRVLRNVVVVGGDIDLRGDASVGWDMVNVLGTTTIDDGASVGRELVVVGGRLNAPLQFRAGRSQNVIALPGGLQALASGIFPWVTNGLLWGRVVVPGLPWMWGVIGIISFVYLAIGFLFPAAVARVGAPLEERPLSTFLVGVASLFLLAPIVFLLAVSVVGIIVIPFFIAAYVLAVLFGRVAVSRRLGGLVLPESDPENRIHALRSLLIGMAILLLAYMVPLLGLLAWMFVGVFGLGGATLAALNSLRKENPRKAKPPVPPTPGGGEGRGAPYPGAPVTPSPYPTGEASFSDLGAQGSGGPGASATQGGSPGWNAPSGAGSHLYEGLGRASAEPIPGPYPPQRSSVGTRGNLLSFPLATFFERLAALAIDISLVALTFFLLPIREDFGFFLFCLLIYFIGFWAWKGATIGGTILQLRVVQSNGELPRFGEAIVRGFSGIFSLGVAGIGGLWILWDPERQGWHDRIAGTHVVKVPRDFPF